MNEREFFTNTTEQHGDDFRTTVTDTHPTEDETHTTTTEQEVEEHHEEEKETREMKSETRNRIGQIFTGAAFSLIFVFTFLTTSTVKETLDANTGISEQASSVSSTETFSGSNFLAGTTAKPTGIDMTDSDMRFFDTSATRS